MANLDQVHKLLAGGYANMPQPQDTEKWVFRPSIVVHVNTLLNAGVVFVFCRPRYYVPRNPYTSPVYYPQTTNRLLSSPALFQQLDVETLFYVFYFLPGTYQQ
jgi:CCR4-NOT transcription complex subunit 3